MKTMLINAEGMDFQELNETIRESSDPDIVIENCLGQRYIGSGTSGRNLTILGTPGNALAAYMDGSRIIVKGNAQDATGDTMNEGTIFIHGSSGDATGYAMRGGRIYVEGSTGYRAGIHMKAYQEKKPVLIVGGTAGSFLGEYQAGGLIVVLGLDRGDKPIVGNFCGTGMHGGKMFLRTDALPPDLPKQVKAAKAAPEDLEEIVPYLQEFCGEFHKPMEEILTGTFLVLTPDTANPYKQLYTQN